MPRRSRVPMPAVLNLTKSLSDSGCLRIELALSAHAPIINGQPTLQAIYVAHLFVPREQFSHRFVDLLPSPIVGDSPADVLRQLADIFEAGDVPLHAD